ncbi:MAG: HD domain-containing protein [Oscillospiraceae bacterium]|nr:HD domain-containing protein [Oscillospiraceae bacterium]
MVKAQMSESELMEQQMETPVMSIVSVLVEHCDNATGGHIHRTQAYLKRLIYMLIEENIYYDEISSWSLDILLSAAQLHDVGKITIGDVILKKPSSLTVDEYAIMKTHVQAGIDVISLMERKSANSSFFNYAKNIAGTHHEKWNGTGYPNCLKETDIPLEGRLMAVVDVYDALVSPRIYKEPYSPSMASKIIIEGSGICFDPKIVDAFVILADEFAQMSKDFS